MEENQVGVGKTQHLVLVGPMGAGKTTIGRQLAKACGRTFFDSDQEIEKKCNADIGWIYDIEGEEGFRKREENIIEELLNKSSGIVLATGGGAILSQENRGVIMSKGYVIYLQVSLEQQLLRMDKDKKRPALQGEDMKEIEKRKELLKTMHEQRHALYSEIADLVITTDEQTPFKTTTIISNQLNLQ